ncbi:REP-associated tyrosine transposase [Algoriphagus marincola]|uniref:REP-associated tyrosine transposase n=1 Tax=Algoriphagus marincola TaxID=264027 RepID=UPI00042075F7|nr:transposase [Algoriphagus marincola]
MSRKYKIWDQDKLYFVTFTVVEWIDVFTNQVYRDIFLDSLRFSQQNKGLDLCAYCIMSNHVHLIIGRNGEITIEDLIRDIKKYTSKNIIEAINQSSSESRKALLLERFGKAGRKNLNNTNFQFWQQHSHPIELNTNDKINRCLNYIHQNPVKAGIVCLAEEYLYSSAKNYAGLPDKLIDVILID